MTPVQTRTTVDAKTMKAVLCSAFWTGSDARKIIRAAEGGDLEAIAACNEALVMTGNEDKRFGPDIMATVDTLLAVEAPQPERKSRKYPTLPLGPLWETARVRSEMPDVTEEAAANLGFTAAWFANMIGFHPKAVARWQKAGDRIPWDSADEAAVRLGKLPQEVWGDEWYDTHGDYDAIAAGEFDSQIEASLRQVAMVMQQEQMLALAEEGLAD